MPQSATTPMPLGLTYDDRGLVARGVVARQIATHRVEPRQGRTVHTCSFDYLGGNTMMSMHLAEIQPGGSKCDHRHLDETMGFIATGTGYSLYRQDDSKENVRIDWKMGDVIVTPTNAYHKHCNASEIQTARQLSFRNSPFMRTTLHGDKDTYALTDTLYNLDGRFTNRFNDEPDYFSLREEIRPGLIKTHFIRQIVDEPVPAVNPDYGEGVAMQRYDMGGQRTLDVALIAIESSGAIRPHRPINEESFIVLVGEGRTELWDDRDHSVTIEWMTGDLVTSPLGVYRRHLAGSGSEVRLLRVRNVAIERALGYEDFGSLELTIPERFPSLIEVPSQ